MSPARKSTTESTDSGGEHPQNSEEKSSVHIAGLLAAPAIGLLVYFATPQLPGDQRTLAAIMAGVAVAWITEAIPLAAAGLIGVALTVVLGVTEVKSAWSGLSDHVVVLVLGSFILARAITCQGLDRRLAYRVLQVPWFGRSVPRMMLAFGIIVALLSSLISNSATAAMITPIAMGVLGAVVAADDRERPGLSSVNCSVLLMIAYSASLGGMLTPIGTGTNVLGKSFLEEYTGLHISFGSWVLLAAPAVVAMLTASIAVLRWANRPPSLNLDKVAEHARHKLRESGRWTRGQLNTVAVFSIAAVLWILPGILKSAGIPKLSDMFPESVVAILAAGLLFILPVNVKKRTFTLTWKQASGIDWNTILLLGSGVALGKLTQSTGLAETAATWLMGVTGAQSVLMLTLMATALTVVISDLMSNVAAVNITVPVIINLAVEMGINPAVPAIAAILGASCSFLLPVSTPPNSIVYGTGEISLAKMVRSGAVLDLLGIVVVPLGVLASASILGYA